MESQSPLIDHEFALKQFSGNNALLLKMLDKFIQQYQGVGELLQALFAKQDIPSIKLQVHTIKGVSGNLGMTALHRASRMYEVQIDESKDSTTLDSYIAVINLTLDKVKQVITEGGQSKPPSKLESDTTSIEPKKQLLDALNRNEFLTKNKLAGLLGELVLSEEQKTALQNAIADFDYENAKKILG